MIMLQMHYYILLYILVLTFKRFYTIFTLIIIKYEFVKSRIHQVFAYYNQRIFFNNIYIHPLSFYQFVKSLSCH